MVEWPLEIISKAISMLGQMLVADEDAGDPEHGQEGGGLALPAHVQPAVGAQPGDGALDLLPVPSQTLGGLDARTGQTHPDATFAQPAALSPRMVGLVAVELGGTPPPGASP